jgi:hypothetical protein
VGVIDCSFQQITVYVKAQFVILTDCRYMVGLFARLDGSRRSHSIAVGGKHFQITTIHPPEDGIIPIGADGEIVEIVPVYVAAKESKVAAAGAGGQMDIRLHAHVVEPLSRIGPGEPVWLVQFNEVLTPSITALKLLILSLAPPTVPILEVVLKKRGLIVTSSAATGQQQ